MIQALLSGVSGMKAFKSSLDVIGNNIANVNTTAFKASRASFKEMLAQTLKPASGPSSVGGGTNPFEIGLGVTVGSIDTDLSQGAMLSTGRDADLAIEGNGYFVLSSGEKMSYTRDGSFALDAANNLVSSSTGLYVLGWTADPNTGEIDTSAPINADSKIAIPIGKLSVARQTSTIRVGGNLDAIASVGDSRSIRFTIYDSLGAMHDVEMVFTKAENMPNPPNEPVWQYTINCPDASSNPVATGQITFDSLGHSKVASVPISITFADPNGSVQPLTATIYTDGISQLNGESTVDMTYQDGLPMGVLESFSITRYGMVVGRFSNGSTLNIAQIALADFNNPAGLAKIGNNLLLDTANSGVARYNAPGVGGLGLVSSGFLEGSNVDLANEFANMIVAQRGFQANSRVISVSDEVLQELVTLKR
ncbi:MAG: flagellar hook protein FlgE [Armatimonadota bacterium]